MTGVLQTLPDDAVPVRDDPQSRPSLAFLPGRQRRAEDGHPWIYSNEVAIDAAAKALPAGTLVTVLKPDGKRLGVASFNPHTLIAARILSRDATERIDRAFILRRLRRALALRERLFEAPFYRLVHAEADELPGLVIDRFGPVVVCQFNTAGMARLEGEVLAALGEALHAEAILIRNDSPARLAEGLEIEQRTAKGTVPDRAELVENDARFLVSLGGGQKTGWFYDQRASRRFVARLARGAGSVLDLYCFGGGFAIPAALAGARDILGIDRSEPALALAHEAARVNGVEKCCRFQRGEAFAELARLGHEKARFDIVIADPPAFVKSRKDLGAGLRGYRKLARLAAGVVAKGGYLFIASCSHNADPASFAEAVRHGVNDADRTARIIRSAGADADHPVHPALPESSYLKSLTLLLD